MSLRSQINSNPAVAATVSVAVIAGALGLVMLVTTGRVDKSLGDTYFYDRNTGRIIAASPGSGFPPITTDSGPYQGEPAAVGVFIYHCGSCSDYRGMTLQEVKSSGASVAYLKKLPAKAKEQAQGDSLQEQQAAMQQFVVQKPGGEQWVHNRSEPAQEIFANARPECDGEKATLCQP
jgi:hypothetical protein